MKRGAALRDPGLALVTPEMARTEAVRVRAMRRADSFAPARCPACRGDLVARMGRGGPAFFCNCDRRQ